MANPRPEKSETLRGALREELGGAAWILGALLGALWTTEIVDSLLGGPLDRFGIWPREVGGLVGIPLWPLLHAGFAHLAGNTLGLLLFGGMLLLRSRREFALVTVLSTFVGGLLVWSFGGSGVHLGASGLVFGYFGYLVAMGLFERKVGSILISLLLVFGYGSMIFGALPGQEGISWEGHLFGLLVGAGTSWLVVRRRRRKDAAAR